MSTRILVVDDEPTITRACAKILSRAGYDVVEIIHSPDALTLLRQETFDLLLTDIRMPVLDGMQLLTEAARLDPHLSVIVITGYGTMEDAVQAIRLGAQGFILKPYNPEELLAVIEENLRRRDQVRDSVRLQTLLPLLKLSDALQEGKGAESITQEALQIAAKEFPAGSLQLWLQQPEGGLQCIVRTNQAALTQNGFSEVDLKAVIRRGQALSRTKTGDLIWEESALKQVTGICLPLISKPELLGVLVADLPADVLPLSNFQLELLQVLSRQLGIAIENINLFNRVGTLGAFNKNIIENISTGLIALDYQGNITVFNRSASILLGLEAGDLLRQHITQALSPFSELADILMEPLSGDQATIHRNLVLKHWDDSNLNVVVTASALYDAQQQLTGVLGLIEDLTELKMLEAESRRLDRLAALGEMAAVVAHELRNPIAGIATGIEYLTKRLDLTSAEYQGSQMILKEVDRVHRIVEDILLVARPLNLQKETITLKSILENVYQRHEATLKQAGITFSVAIDDSLPDLFADGDRLEQVFDNLMSNAVQAMVEGGRIQIQVCPEIERQCCLIQFSDTGPGISPKAQEKIFEPFFTTRNRGAGLGLALSRRILEAHGAGIAVTASTETGTTFEITFPLSERRPGAP